MSLNLPNNNLLALKVSNLTTADNKFYDIFIDFCIKSKV